MTNKIAIIGAGFDGLGVASRFVHAGVDYQQFDARDEVGGIWYDGTYDSIHTVTSRRTTEFPSFPMPAHYPDFPSGQQMREYFARFADRAGLRKHLNLKTRVVKVEPVDQQWRLSFASGAEQTYAGVVIANGHYWDPRYPDYAADFTGQSLHSMDYRRPDIFSGKRVLVIGGGNSGVDIASEAGHVAQRCCISLRRSLWYLPKTFFGRPTIEMSNPWIPKSARRVLVHSLLRASVGTHADYGLPKPDHALFDLHTNLNTKLFDSIAHGRVHPRPGIRSIHGQFVHFDDGSSEEFDMVCFATGYNFGLPFLASDVVKFGADQLTDLIDGMFAARHRNLYVVGMNITLYGHGPVIEPTGDMLVQFIRTQERLEHANGEVLARLGYRPLRSYLLDPHRSIRRTRRLARTARYLPQLERWLMRSGRQPAQGAAAALPKAPLKSDRPTLALSSTAERRASTPGSNSQSARHP